LKDGLGDISTPSELLDYMDRELYLYNNLAILQAFSLSINPPDEELYEKCLRYGRKAKDVFYFQKSTHNLKGEWAKQKYILSFNEFQCFSYFSIVLFQAD
jgi:hypothetical protein